MSERGETTIDHSEATGSDSEVKKLRRGGTSSEPGGSTFWINSERA